MKNKKIVIGEGHPVKSKKDIVNFLKYMSKKYNIVQESGIVDAVVNDYVKSPKGKDHIVMNNVGNEWFLKFLSNDEVLAQMEMNKKTKIIS